MKYLSLQNRKIIIIGFGAIGPAVLPLIIRHIDMPSNQIEIIASNCINKELAERENVKFELFELTPENYDNFLSKRLKENDILLNLSVNISSLDLIKLCQKQKALYLDTSNETWPATHTNSTPITTYERRYNTLQAKASFANGPTALICHGANPGLVSHFAKQAVLDVAKKLGINTETNEWGKIAQASDIAALHISERDSQISQIIRTNNEYANTWSVYGFLDEIFEPVSFALGTHEKPLPRDYIKKQINTSPCRVIELNSAAYKTQVKSWIPSLENFYGHITPHPEAFSIAELFSVQDNNKNLMYQPTVHFVYQPCNDAVASMYDAIDLQGKNSIKNNRILLHDVISGMDELGILVLRNNTSEIYWYGSRLSIDTARSLVHNNNATSLQVAAGVISGLIWIIENPKLGLIEPEQADYKRILEIASPYLGIIEGQWATWPNICTVNTKEQSQVWNFSEIVNFIHQNELIA